MLIKSYLLYHYRKCGRCSNGDCYTSHSTSNKALIIFDALDRSEPGRGLRIQLQLRGES